jgi:predicted MFS family arabinose efflux permease
MEEQPVNAPKKNAPAKKAPFTLHQKFIIAILALLQFSIILDFLVISPLSAMLMKSMDMTTANFGMVVSAYAFSAGISGLLAAGFADKFDRKKLLIFFYVGFILGTLFCAFSISYHMLLLARIVTGLFGGVIGSILLAIMTDLFAINQRGRVLGVIQMAFASSQILGIPIGLYFANLWGWHSVFLMIDVLAFAILVAVIVVMEPVNKHLNLQSDKNPFLHVWHTLRNKNYQTGLIAVAVLGMVGFMLQPFNSVYLVNNIHMTYAQLPIIFFSIGIAVLFIMPIIGKLSDKISKFKFFTVGCILSIIMVIIYTNLPPLPIWQVVIISMGLFMVIMGRVVPATTLNTGIPEAKDRGAYMSVTASMQQMAGGIASVCAGYVVRQQTPTGPLMNYNFLGYLITGLTLISIILIYRVDNIVRKKSQAAEIP